MPIVLKNSLLEIHIDLPTENYLLSRFDWTGKIRTVRYRNNTLTGVERTDWDVGQDGGRGLYNEFGIQSPLGYADAKLGESFHKIGIGLLQKNDSSYDFLKTYPIRPAEHSWQRDSNKLMMTCISSEIYGFAYILKKEIELIENRFVLTYYLTNTGNKPIETDEYNHNFLAINYDLIGSVYILKWPFSLVPTSFDEIVNPEQVVDLGENQVSFSGTPQDPFFFSNLTGGKKVPAKWELVHKESGIGISETGSFLTDKVNLWGWRHVISPELFIHILVETGQTMEWSRTYEVYEL